jgi:SNF2 family DNA or RNA helicase
MAEFYHSSARVDMWDGNGETDGENEHSFKRCAWSLKCGAGELSPGADITFVKTSITGVEEEYPVFTCFMLFKSFSNADGTSSYNFLFYLFKLLNLIIRAGGFIPSPYVRNNKLQILWMPYIELPAIKNEFKNLENYLLQGDSDILNIAGKKRKNIPVDPPSLINIISSALITQYVINIYNPRPGPESAAAFYDLFFKKEAFDVKRPVTKILPRSISNWLLPLRTDFKKYKYIFTLTPSVKADTTEFNLKAEVALPARSKTGIKTKKVLLCDSAKAAASLDVLKAPTTLSAYLPELKTLFTKKSVKLNEKQLISFLDDSSVLLEQLGIEIILPKQLHRELKPRLVLQADVKTKRKKGNLVSYLNLDNLVSWKWQVAIGDEVLTYADFIKLVAEQSPIVKFRDKFIRLDADALRALFNAKNKNADAGAIDFIRAHLQGETLATFDANKILSTLFHEQNESEPASLNAALRPYQLRGFNWILSLLKAGFGCILGDDMGLGKTIQSIAVLLRLKELNLLENSNLIIAPASLLENWARELKKFAPALNVRMYHGKGRNFEIKENETKSDVYLTTYQTVVRDVEIIGKIQFSLIIVDEAHLLKNAETRGSKTVKSLSATYRLALSGTPVENHLEDLRSLFDFIIPGFLGTPSEFNKKWRTPIELHRQKNIAEELKKITGPFLLRRLKTDKKIINDLPDKIIQNEYAALEKTQAALYESLVAQTLEKSETAETYLQRSALILTLLTGLKQICDHPKVFDKESPARSELSGKAQLLLTLLGEILRGGEKVLIFSQYVETLSVLNEIITNELHEEALIYHGGLNAKRKAEVVDIFQNNAGAKILLISLKAGGLGLNLTSASHVIHYDLWYNPAVENQATDRAFRIGQKRNVFVHRFITRGSFEEKIDDMLKQKTELSSLTLSQGESWLARMTHEELKELFTA